MTTINPNSVSGNKNFKQIESDSWTSLYLPAICAAILMGGVLFLAVSCSKTSTSASKISAPTQSSAASTPPSSSSTPIATASERTKKVAKKRRPANATYVNSAYGVSFSYPRKYSLQSGDKLAASTSLPTGFLKPGAVQVAAVDMPDSSYPETDFSSALLNVSVNKEVTSDECMQFGGASKAAGEVKLVTGKLGANEYSVFEQIIGEGNRKSDLKYFHLFKNNACYEFALDLDTTDKVDSDLAQVDRGKVFHQLEAILMTVKIKDLRPTEVENAGNATTTTAAPSTAEVKTTDAKTAEGKTTDAKTAEVKDEQTVKAQVVTPEPKPEQK